MSISGLMRALEENWAAIRAEYQALPQPLKTPWVDEIYNKGWTIAGLVASKYSIEATKTIEEGGHTVRTLCPRTVAILDAVRAAQEQTG